MGTDYVPFVVEDTVNRVELADRSEALNRLWRQWRFSLTVGLARPWFERSEETDRWDALEPDGLAEAQSAFQALVAVDVDLEGGPVDSYRVHPVVDNPALPDEWRLAAWGNILPDELPLRCQQWTTFVDQVEAGDWSGYQFDAYLYRWATDEFAHQQLDLLRRSAQASQERDNAWASKPRHIEARQAVLDSSVLAQWVELCRLIPEPVFGPDRRHQTVTEHQRDIEQALMALRDEGAGLIGQWNRTAPSSQKIRPPALHSFEEHLDNLRVGLRAFLRWCEPLVAKGCGLYLWP